MANLKRLFLFYFKRQWRSSLIWVAILSSLSIAVLVAYTSMYGTAEAIASAFLTLENPAMTAMIGKTYGPGRHGLAVIFAMEMYLFTAIAIGVMNIFLATNLTRGEEDGGRGEIVRALPLQRSSPIIATFMMIVGVNLVLGLVFTIGLFATRVDNLSLGATALYSFSLASIGILFGTLTTFIAQVFSNARQTLMAALGLLIFFYLLRAIGDSTSSFLSYLSPLGLLFKTEIFYRNHLYPTLIIAMLAIIFGALTFHLYRQRDYDQGLIKPRLGRGRAGKVLTSPFGLPLRLTGSSIITWLVVLFIFGVAYGSIAGDIESYLASNEWLKQMIKGHEGFSYTEIYVAMMMSIFALMVTIGPMSIIGRLQSEERQGRLDICLAAPTTRLTVFARYVIIAFSTAVLLALSGVIGLYSIGATSVSDGWNFFNILASLLVYLPAIFVFIALSTFLLAFFPTKMWLNWCYLGLSFFIIYIGQMLNLPSWLTFFTPFGYVSQVPLETINWWFQAGMVLVAGGLVTISIIGYRQRDLG